jgi:hypothetical protein
MALNNNGSNSWVVDGYPLRRVKVGEKYEWFFKVLKIHAIEVEPAS